MKNQRKPDWLKMPSIGDETAGYVRLILSKHGINTVCNEAKCPNRGHCYQRGTATFLLLGKICTRSCRYCAIGKIASTPLQVDPTEPVRIADVIQELKLDYVVLTSVTRDDLPDGGAGIFAETILEIKRRLPFVRIEVLTPDFKGDENSLKIIANCPVNVFNHNLETVLRLFPQVRPEASYTLSLKILKKFSLLKPDCRIKSGLMLGLGESENDIKNALNDLKNASVEIITLGQYLAPSKDHWPVTRYLSPEEFDFWKDYALSIGFYSVSSGPLVRSSFHADLIGIDSNT